MNEQDAIPASGHTDPVAPDVQPGTEAFAFCQNCGRALTQQSARAVGQSMFCEPCLEARLAGAPGQPPPGANPYSGPGYPVDPYATAWVPGTPGLPNPGLATLLGFIPGVGAMYNEQYAKGIVHLIVFVLLVTITDSFGIFGIFIAGWEFYMAIDANHTARARRDGLPLPNPFGLNDIGERLGFGKAWPGNPDVSGTARAAAQQASQAMRDAAAYASRSAGQMPGQPAPFTNPNPGPNAAPANPYSQTQQWNSTYTGTTPPAYGSPYPVDTMPVASTPLSRFPGGAVWLVAIGLWFLLDAFHWIHLHHTWPLLLIVAGVMALLERLFFNASQTEVPPVTVPPGNGDWSPAMDTTASSVSAAPETTKGGN